MLGMNGSTKPLACRRDRGQDRCTKIATDIEQLVEVDRARARCRLEASRNRVRNAGRSQLRGQVLCQALREDRAHEGERDRATDLAEEGQVRRRHAQLAEGNRVLDDDREDRECRAHAQAGDQHPCPQDGQWSVLGQLGHEQRADADQRDRPDQQPLVATGLRDDEPGRDGAHDEPADKRKHAKTGVGWREVLDELEPARQEHHGPEKGKCSKEGGDHGCRVGSAAPQVERNDRLLGARLGQHEEHVADDAREDEASDLPVGPQIKVAWSWGR